MPSEEDRGSIDATIILKGKRLTASSNQLSSRNSERVCTHPRGAPDGTMYAVGSRLRRGRSRAPYHESIRMDPPRLSWQARHERSNTKRIPPLRRPLNLVCPNEHIVRQRRARLPLCMSDSDRRREQSGGSCTSCCRHARSRLQGYRSHYVVDR